MVTVPGEWLADDFALIGALTDKRRTKLQARKSDTSRRAKTQVQVRASPTELLGVRHFDQTVGGGPENIAYFWDGDGDLVCAGADKVRLIQQRTKRARSRCVFSESAAGAGVQAAR